MDISLTIVDGVILEAAYETYPCPASHVCGKAICEMVKGRRLEEAPVRWQQLADRVGPLPRAKRICYSLAVLALEDALRGCPTRPGGG